MVNTIVGRIDRRLLIGLAVVLLAGALVNVFNSPKEMRTVTAHFPRAVSVYENTDVRVLGVTIGKVTSVIPAGNSVQVRMEYDASYKVPADAKAVIVTPTLVADRFIQLTPVYDGGEALADGAEIELPDTGVPVELDRIYASLQTLTRALGPNGVNADGTLNNLLQAGEKAFDGQGAKGNQMIRDLAQAAETFGEGAGPLFETVTYLAEFTKTLAENDTLVRAFMQDLTGVSAMLAEESDELQQAVAAVARAVGSVKGFVRDNREALVTDVKKLTEVMRTIASEKDNIDTAVKIAPVAMGNLHMGFDHVSGSQNSRINVGGNIKGIAGFVCGLIYQVKGMPPELQKVACNLVEALIEPLTSKLPWLPPEHASNNPNQRKTKGIPLPAVTEVDYSVGDDASVETLLGGGS